MTNNNQHSKKNLQQGNSLATMNVNHTLQISFYSLLTQTWSLVHGVLCKHSRQEENMKEACSFKSWRYVVIKGVEGGGKYIEQLLHFHERRYHWKQWEAMPCAMFSFGTLCRQGLLFLFLGSYRLDIDYSRNFKGIPWHFIFPPRLPFPVYYRSQNS